MTIRMLNDGVTYPDGRPFCFLTQKERCERDGTVGRCRFNKEHGHCAFFGCDKRFGLLKANGEPRRKRWQGVDN